MAYNLRDRSKMNKKATDWSSSEDDTDYDLPAKRLRRKMPVPVVQVLEDDRPSTSKDGGEGTQMEAVAPGNQNGNALKEAARVGVKEKEEKERITILSWLTDMKKIEEDDIVRYTDPDTSEVKKEGMVKKGDIKCLCCKKVFTVWKFEGHAGGAHFKRPYYNIIVARTRKSLSFYLDEAWSVLKPNDDFGTKYNGSKKDNHDSECIICGDGGELTCCDGCALTYHHLCMNMEKKPEGDWYCPYCICKFCGLRDGAENEFFTCFQCEKNFHFHCSDGFSRHQQRESVVNDNANPLIVAFCSKGCREIFERLESIVGVKHTVYGTWHKLSYTLIRRMHPRAGVYIQDEHQRLEINSKIFLAWRVLNAGFEDSFDDLTHTDVIRSITFNCGFGSNYPRLNYSGFYTIILECNDEILSAATLRIHGTKFAEMPYFSTRADYRMEKMSHKLIGGVEFFLRSMQIETLVIPSIADVQGMWRNKFCFSNVRDDMMRDISKWKILMIPSTVRLQKCLLSQEQMRAIRETENRTTLLQALDAGAHGQVQRRRRSSSTRMRLNHDAASTSGARDLAEADQNICQDVRPSEENSAEWPRCSSSTSMRLNHDGASTSGARELEEADQNICQDVRPADENSTEWPRCSSSTSMRLNHDGASTSGAKGHEEADQNICQDDRPSDENSTRQPRFEFDLNEPRLRLPCFDLNEPAPEDED